MTVSLHIPDICLLGLSARDTSALERRYRNLKGKLTAGGGLWCEVHHDNGWSVDLTGPEELIVPLVTLLAEVTAP